SGPAQRSLTVAYATLYTGGSDGFVSFTAAPIATGWSEQFPGGTFTRSEPAPFTAHVISRFINNYEGTKLRLTQGSASKTLHMTVGASRMIEMPITNPLS